MSTSGGSSSPVTIQISQASLPSTPSWFGEVAVVAHVLTQFKLLTAIEQRVRFARARFGQYDLIDFVVVLIGSILSGEPTLKAFYEQLAPFAEPFMARDKQPANRHCRRRTPCLLPIVVSIR